MKSCCGDLVVVGQSYGGMIVSGAADVAHRGIQALVYVDAYAPDSGDSVSCRRAGRTALGLLA